MASLYFAKAVATLILCLEFVFVSVIDVCIAAIWSWIHHWALLACREGDQCGRQGFQQRLVETQVPLATEQILLANLFQWEGMQRGYSCRATHMHFPPTLLLCCPGNSILGSGRKTQQGKQHLLPFYRNSETFGCSGREGEGHSVTFLLWGGSVKLHQLYRLVVWAGRVHLIAGYK